LQVGRSDFGLFLVYPDFSSCIIRLVKNRASGFRSLLPFVDMIFLTAGDLDLPGQFQLNFASFKTLGLFMVVYFV